MKLTLTVLLSFLLSLPLFSQQKFEVAAISGATYFLGDLNMNKVEYELIRGSFGLAMRYNIEPQWIIKAQAMTGKIAGDDKYTPNEATRGAYFNNRYYSSSLAVEYLPLRKPRSINYRFLPSWSPYVTAGIEYLRSVDKAKCRHCGNLLPEIAKDAFIAGMFGVGARLDLFKHFSFGGELIWHPVFSDYLDGISKIGNPENNDWMIGLNGYVSYFFGGVKPEY